VTEADGTTMRVLFVSDTHLGFDLPARPRVDRRRRGPDFFSCFERALEPALRGEADVVVHGGDLLYRSRVPAWLVQRALAPLVRVADAGVPVLLVPGNHERSAIPYPLLAAHEHLHVFRGPSTVAIERGGLRVAFAGIPYARSVRQAFPALLAATGYRGVEADARVLCIHQCVEGAICGPPPGFTFRDGDDVVRASDLPGDVAVVLCGHVHRHQVLRRDLRGRPLPAPVVYAGSVERTSFAERDETKGFVMAAVGAGDGGGRLLACEFRPLPARPMRVHEVADTSPASGLEREIAAAVAAAPADVVLQVRVPEALAGAAALRAARLRALGPPTANLSVSVRLSGTPRRALFRGDLFQVHLEAIQDVADPQPQLRGIGREDGAGVGPVQHPDPGAHFDRELSGGPSGVAGVDAQPAGRVTFRERGPDVGEVAREVDVGQDRLCAGARARHADEREDRLGLDGAAPVDGEIGSAGLLDLHQGLGEGHLRGPVHHEAHRALRPVPDEQHHRLREAGVRDAGSGVQEEARPQACGIPVRGGARGRPGKGDARHERGGSAEHGLPEA
jgi:DNA repair exonuclease SbcCD nuclease subunit